MADCATLCLTAATCLPTRHGAFRMESFRYGADPLPHLALSIGLGTGRTPLVRVHSECVTGEVFASLRCDCDQQLQEALRRIQAAGSGVLIYLRQEGRGIGIENKLKAYALQDQGLDTIDANVALGLPIDARSYQPALAYLQHQGIRRCTLLTNNPDKLRALQENGIRVVRAPLRAIGHGAALGYLETKRQRLGHDC